MNLLLDTNAFMWLHARPDYLSKKAKSAIVDTENTVFLSVASVWEMQIKIKIGKFNFAESLSEVISSQQIENDIEVFPIALSHALFLENLDLHHKDPFDRLLISQANVEEFVVVTSDRSFRKYPVRCLW